MINLSMLLAVGAGGFFGAVTRFTVGVQVAKHYPHHVELATVSVNIVGSFLIGMLISFFIIHTPPTVLKGFLITGFLGALTTYSTFAIESYMLLNSNFWYGVLNICLNLFGTIMAAGAGYKLIAHFIK